VEATKLTMRAMSRYSSRLRDMMAREFLASGVVKYVCKLGKGAEVASWRYVKVWSGSGSNDGDGSESLGSKRYHRWARRVVSRGPEEERGFKYIKSTLVLEAVKAVISNLEYHRHDHECGEMDTDGLRIGSGGTE